MSIIETTLDLLEFNRGRTLGLLDEIEKQPDPASVLGWRPGPKRAHVAWQLMHIGITEELFATERLFGRPPAFVDIVPRFKGGSTPDEDIPSVDSIRELLGASREHLRRAVGLLSETDLATVPDALKERGWTIGRVLQVLAWHEPHHQGQAHLAVNLWKAAHS